MDRATRNILEQELRGRLDGAGISLSQDVVDVVRRILQKSGDVPQDRFDEAAKNWQRLYTRAIKRAAADGRRKSLSEDDFEQSLSALCPIWPFC